jgi:hypothetical protein
MPRGHQSQGALPDVIGDALHMVRIATTDIEKAVP